MAKRVSGEQVGMHDHSDCREVQEPKPARTRYTTSRVSGSYLWNRYRRTETKMYHWHSTTNTLKTVRNNKNRSILEILQEEAGFTGMLTATFSIIPTGYQTRNFVETVYGHGIRARGHVSAYGGRPARGTVSHVDFDGRITLPLPAPVEGGCHKYVTILGC